MQARIVAGSRGARWVAEGWRLFRGAPFGWLAAVFGYWLVMTVVSLLPLIGIAAAALLVPAFSVGFMALARAASRGARLEVAFLLDGFRHEPRTQLVLGSIYLVALALLLAASRFADDGALALWMLTGARPSEEMLDSPAFIGALLTAAALYLPVMFAFWFAPALAAWHGTGALKALFFSLAASLMNWRAFLVYGAVTGAITLAAPLLLVQALAFAGVGRIGPGIVLPLAILLLPTLFASFYASYRDVFGYDAPP
ncbi:MAG: BPSS1780 family membrane protein [Burkholderiales bacterium]